MPLLSWCAIHETPKIARLFQNFHCVYLWKAPLMMKILLWIEFMKIKHKMLRGWDCTQSKSLLHIFYVNLLHARHSGKPPLLQATLEENKTKKQMLESPCLLLLLFLLHVCLIRPGNSPKFRKSYLCALQLFFCAVDTFLIQLRCCYTLESLLQPARQNKTVGSCSSKI